MDSDHPTPPVPRCDLAPISTRDDDPTLVECPACHEYHGTCLLCGGVGYVSHERYSSWRPPPHAA